MTSNEDIVNNVNQISWYKNRVSTMMSVYVLKGVENFPEWLNKFEYVADIFRIPDDKMVELFNNMVDNGVHKYVKKSNRSVEFSKFSYEKITDYYLRQFASSSSEDDPYKIRLFNRNQYEQETLEKYADNLRKIYKKCNDMNDLEERLCEQFINGCHNDELKKYLREIPNVSFDETVTKAIEFVNAKKKTHYEDHALSMNPTYKKDISWYRSRALTMMPAFEEPNLKYVYQFCEWVNRFQYVANIISVPRSKMVEFFLTMVSDDIHKYVQKKNSDINLRELPYESIINLYFIIAANSAVEGYRICLKYRNQYEQEPIKYYANCLRNLLKKCNYKLHYNNKKICARLYDGLRKGVIRTYLKSIKCKSLDEIIAKAIEFEKNHLETYYRNYALLKIDAYNKEKEGEFTVWLNRFEYVADLIDVPESKMGKLFIEMVDNDINQSVMQAHPSVNFNELSYDELPNYYHRHCFSDDVDLHRQRLSCREQYEQETIENYAYSLRKLFHKCTDRIEQEESLCEQFINGLRENELRNHLRETNYESFDEMIASAIEFAKVNLISYYRDRALLKIDIYNERNEGDFYIWLNKFEYVAYTIDVPKSKMVKLFVEMVDDDDSQSVMQANPSVDFNKLTYDKKIEYYLKFYTPNEKDLHLNCYIYRHQYEHELTKTYAYFLHKYYNKSNFKENVDKDLYKRFIDRIRENETRNYLRTVRYVSFDESVKIAIKFEKDNLVTYYRDHAILKINTYNPRKEGLFYDWLNRFEYVADMIDVPDSKMGRLFIEMVNDDIHVLFNKAFPKVKSNKLPYDEKINYYLRYFFPNEVELHKPRIFCRKQYKQETIENYFHNLRRLFHKCTFTSDLEKELFEHSINGLREHEVRNYLRENDFISFDEMVAKAIEFAKINLITYYRDQALLKIDIYNEENEGEFYVWLNKFEFVANIIELPQRKMGKLFIMMIDNKINQSVMQAHPSVDFNELSYDELTNYYHRHFSSNDVDLHKQRLSSREQYEQETIESFAYNLRKLCIKCNYTIDLEEKLFAKFFKGLRENELRHFLLKPNYKLFDDMVTKVINFAKCYLITYYRDHACLKIQDFFSERRIYFHTWLNRFEYVANMIDVPDNKMVELFNKMVDNDVHMRVKGSLPNVQFSELRYEEMIDYYVKYFSFYNVNFHSKRLWERTQYEQERIQNYAYNLQKLFNNIFYSSNLEQKLNEHFINGLRENKVRNYLRETNYESFDEMVAKAVDFEKCNLLTYYRDEAFLEIKTFAPEDERVFHIWLNKFEYVADRINVPNKNMVKFFKLLIHENVQTSVQISFPKVNCSEISYEDIVNIYIRFFSSEGNNIHEKRFLSRNQYEHELIKNYADCLEKLIHMYDQKRNVNDDLCIKFYSGINNNFIKNRLNKIRYNLFEIMVANAIELSKVDIITYYRDKACLFINMYSPRKEGSFYIWLNKFEYVADILRVPKDKMLGFFNMMVHDEVHMSVKKKYSSSNLCKFTYELLIEYYFFYFASLRENDFYKIRFMNRYQYIEEPVQVYANNLRKLYNDCYFASNGVNELRSRFINGIRDQDIQTILIETPSLSFEEIVEKAVALEMRKKELR